MAAADGRSATGIYLNGATIMTTRTARHIEVARAAGFDGVEVRAERLLDAPDEVREAAAVVKPGEVWSLNGIQLQLGSDGRLDRERLEAELQPRLEICRSLGASYLLVVPPRAPGAEQALSVVAMRDGLGRIRDAAAIVEAGTAFEFLGFADCPIDTPELAAEVVSSVPGVELVLDSCHWHASGAGSLDGFPVDRLAMVHLNDAPQKPPREIEDADRVLLGGGVIRLADLVADLTGRGYRGAWSLETFNPTYWADDPMEIATIGRRLLGDLLDPPATGSRI